MLALLFVSGDGSRWGLVVLDDRGASVCGVGAGDHRLVASPVLGHLPLELRHADPQPRLSRATGQSRRSVAENFSIALCPLPCSSATGDTGDQEEIHGVAGMYGSVVLAVITY